MVLYHNDTAYNDIRVMQFMTGGGNNVFRSTVLHIKRIMTSLIVNKNTSQYLVENSRFNVSELLGGNCFSNRKFQ